ncbi:MAG: Na/Pi cotransporter family protein [bacterium]
MIVILIGLLGGFSIFIYGMKITSQGLQKVAGKKLKTIMEKLTGNRLMGVIVGTVVTVLDQSSGATTVMLVSFATAMLITLPQALGVILGADIGTTFTVQLISFKIYEYSLLILSLGFFMMFLSKQKQYRYVGQILLGVGFIFFGMQIMADRVAPLREYPAVVDMFMSFNSRPFAGLIAGAIFAGLVQSSAAVIGLILSMSMQGLIGLSGAIPILLGANIGTCATALLASAGASKEGKRVALAHILFKIIGVGIFVIILKPFIRFVSFSADSLPRQIANAHSLFNIGIAIIFLPFIPLYVKLINLLIPWKKEEEKFGPKYLDTRLLDTPAVALEQAKRELVREANIVLEMLKGSIKVFEDKDEALMRKLQIKDDEVDTLHLALVSYLTTLGQGTLTDYESKEEIKYLYMSDDLESIGDIIDKNVMSLAKKLIEERCSFSNEGWQEIRSMHSRIVENLDMSIKAIIEDDRDLARRVTEAKSEIGRMESDLRKKHIERLHCGFKESIGTSNIHLDVIDQFKSINSHISGISFAVMGKLIY